MEEPKVNIILLDTFYFRASDMSGKDFGGFSCDAADSEAAFTELHKLIEETWPDNEIHLEEVNKDEYYNWLDPELPVQGHLTSTTQEV